MTNNNETKLKMLSKLSRLCLEKGVSGQQLTNLLKPLRELTKAHRPMEEIEAKAAELIPIVERM